MTRKITLTTYIFIVIKYKALNVNYKKEKTFHTIPIELEM